MKEIKSLPVKRQVSVSGILKKLGVSRSGYNAWKKRVLSDTSVRRAVLKEKQYKKPSGGDVNEKILLSCENDIFGKDGIHESSVV